MSQLGFNFDPPTTFEPESWNPPVDPTVCPWCRGRLGFGGGVPVAGGLRAHPDCNEEMLEDGR